MNVSEGNEIPPCKCWKDKDFSACDESGTAEEAWQGLLDCLSNRNC